MGGPNYVPKEAVSEVAERMKAQIQGINPGAGITRFSIQMKEYELSDSGYEFFTGSEGDCFDAFESTVANKEWVIVPLWKPQFLHYRYDIREIKEPKGLLGIVDRAVLLLRNDKKSLFSEEQIQKLDSLRFSNDIIAELDYKVCREGKSQDAVTHAWLVEKGLI